MRAVDVYLTRKASATWPRAVVYKEDDGSFTLERPDQQPVQLGPHFGRAREALALLRRSEEGKGG